MICLDLLSHHAVMICPGIGQGLSRVAMTSHLVVIKP